MTRRILSKLKRIVVKPLTSEQQLQKAIFEYKQNGCIPWSNGYHEHKWQEIEKTLGNPEIIEKFNIFKGIAEFGVGIDERIIEYPWIFANLSKGAKTLLDAGSTFNHKIIIEQPLVKTKDLSIVTYFPERPNFNEQRVSYVYADLRDIPFKNSHFDEVVCHSTLEHIDMDNSMYGYAKGSDVVVVKNYEYLKVIEELQRVLKPSGTVLITVPYGSFENHVFFQQFDKEMIDKIKTYFVNFGTVDDCYFKYLPTGWTMSNQQECDDCKSYNPHTGIGKGTDNAAHSRAICCLTFIKNKS